MCACRQARLWPGRTAAKEGVAQFREVPQLPFALLAMPLGFLPRSGGRRAIQSSGSTLGSVVLHPPWWRTWRNAGPTRTSRHCGQDGPPRPHLQRRPREAGWVGHALLRPAVSTDVGMSPLAASTRWTSFARLQMGGHLFGRSHRAPCPGWQAWRMVAQAQPQHKRRSSRASKSHDGSRPVAAAVAAAARGQPLLLPSPKSLPMTPGQLGRGVGQKPFGRWSAACRARAGATLWGPGLHAPRPQRQRRRKVAAGGHPLPRRAALVDASSLPLDPIRRLRREVGAEQRPRVEGQPGVRQRGRSARLRHRPLQISGPTKPLGPSSA